MNLKEIKSEDLIFSEELEDDRVNTFLSLDDYDWMNYELRTKFKTKEQGVLQVLFRYFGMNESLMEVHKTINNKTTLYKIEFPTSVFKKHIIIFLTNHIKSWDSTYAFNGEDEVIAFFNEVLEYQNKSEISIVN